MFFAAITDKKLKISEEISVFQSFSYKLEEQILSFVCERAGWRGIRFCPLLRNRVFDLLAQPGEIESRGGRIDWNVNIDVFGRGIFRQRHQLVLERGAIHARKTLLVDKAGDDTHDVSFYVAAENPLNVDVDVENVLDVVVADFHWTICGWENSAR